MIHGGVRDTKWHAYFGITAPWLHSDVNAWSDHHGMRWLHSTLALQFTTTAHIDLRDRLPIRSSTGSCSRPT